MKHLRRTLLVTLLLVSFARSGQTCGGPIVPGTDMDERGIFAVPDVLFCEELARIAAIAPDSFPWPYPYARDERAAPDSAFYLTGWERSLVAEMKDLGTALEENGVPTSPTLVEEYRQMRRDMKIHYHLGSGDASFLFPERGALRRSPSVYLSEDRPLAENSWEYKMTYGEDGFLYPPKKENTPFPLENYRSVLRAIPRESQIYVEGCDFWYAREWEKAAACWETILVLPPKERRYKSIWAAFMIGKARIRTDLGAAVESFERTRQLAQDGFPDPMNLAPESWMWQAFAELRRNDNVSALLHYYRAFLESDTTRSHDAILSISLTCNRILGLARSKSPDDRAFTDPIARQLLVAYSLSHSYAGGWTAALAGRKEEIPDNELERLVWAAYQGGQVETAEKFYQRMRDPTPMAQWIHAKVLLRDGKIEAGKNLMKKVGQSERIRNGVNHDQALISLSEGRYEDALTLFLGSNQDQPPSAYYPPLPWGNGQDRAWYIADRILTVPELEKYVEKTEKGKNGPPEVQKWIPDLRRLLFRRLMRNGLYSKAGKYCPDDTRDAYESFVEHIRGAKNTSKPKRERALHYIAAAFLTQYKGPYLFATKVDPDWVRWYGTMHWDRYDGGLRPPARLRWDEMREQNSYNPVPRSSPSVDFLRTRDDEVRRFEASAPSPNRTFHFRWTASEYMRKAAQLLPNNDLLTAHALRYGGIWISISDPKGADWFYKQMVRRNRKLPIGQEADRLRWFPQIPDTDNLPVELGDILKEAQETISEEREDGKARDDVEGG